MGSGVLDFSHMKSSIKALTCFPYDRLVEMSMKAQKTVLDFFFFFNVKCVMERFAYFM